MVTIPAALSGTRGRMSHPPTYAFYEKKTRKIFRICAEKSDNGMRCTANELDVLEDILDRPGDFFCVPLSRRSRFRSLAYLMLAALTRLENSVLRRERIMQTFKLFQWSVRRLPLHEGVVKRRAQPLLTRILRTAMEFEHKELVNCINRLLESEFMCEICMGTLRTVVRYLVWLDEQPEMEPVPMEAAARMVLLSVGATQEEKTTRFCHKVIDWIREHEEIIPPGVLGFTGSVKEGTPCSTIENAFYRVYACTYSSPDTWFKSIDDLIRVGRGMRAIRHLRRVKVGFWRLLKDKLKDRSVWPAGSLDALLAGK